MPNQSKPSAIKSLDGTSTINQVPQFLHLHPILTGTKEKSRDAR